MTFDGFDAQIPIENSTFWLQPNELGGDGGQSGGPSTLEQAISDSIRPWDPFVWSDDTSSMTVDGYLYVDRDQNGWYDYVEWSEDDDTVWQWKDEDGWKPKENDD